MSKRFTDTEKWGDEWFRKLPPEMKCAWFYVLDRCDAAGFWKPDFDMMTYCIGKKITEDKFIQVFGDRLTKFENGRYQVNKFISFQYGNLVPSNKMFTKVQKLLDENGASIPHRSSIDARMVMDMVMVMDKEKEINEIVNYWNEKAKDLPKVIKLGSRKKHINARLAECADIEKWKAAIDMLNSEDFYLGKNQHNWVANFDYLIRPEKFLGLIEKAQNKNSKPKRKEKVISDFSELD